jgi:hypothetical protein
MRRRRQARQAHQLEYYVETAPAASSSRYRSTEFFIDSQATGLRTRTRYINNPPSPQKRRAAIEDSLTLIPDLPPSTACFDSETQHFDPDYMDFFAQQKQDVDSRTRPSVRVQRIQVLSLLISEPLSLG